MILSLDVIANTDTALLIEKAAPPREYASCMSDARWNRLQVAGAELPATTRVPGGG